MVYRATQFSITPTPIFKVTLFFDAEYLRNCTRYIHDFYGILIGTYTRLTMSFRTTLSDQTNANHVLAHLSC